jgi:hypothetical protein
MNRVALKTEVNMYKNVLSPMLSITRMRGIFIVIASIAGCTSASVVKSPKWYLIVQNMADIRRNLHRFLKGKQLYNALYGLHTEVLHDLTAVLKNNVNKGEITTTTITSRPS